MTNKEILKKIILPGIIIITFIEATFWIITTVQYKEYEKITNNTISHIVGKVMEKYPDVSEDEIIKELKNEDATVDVISKYGYEMDDNYISKLDKNMENTKKANVIIISIFSIEIIFLIIMKNKKQGKRVENIYKYLNELNNKNYTLKIQDNNEDELSKLRNELYKTTILLKETAENSEKEKVELTNSLADISHQIKTPLTSIRIMLDNIEDNPDMDEKTKSEFIREISNQIEWISSLVISLLKLAKFDAGSIVMNNTQINLNNLIEDVLSNLSVLLDAKNINIEKDIDDEIIFNADYKWQKEAISNIIKNAIEHSNEKTKITIKAEDTSLFVKITIQDEGEGIDRKDIKHIFDRFYKTKKSSENSIGIGLALSKTIIEKENGYIRVESEIGKGTKFEIKYLK